MTKRKSRKAREAEQFHATVVSLLRDIDPSRTEFEENWLADEARRSIGYIYTPREREILNQIIAASRRFTHYAGFSVQELARMTYQYRADLSSFEDEELVTSYLKRDQSELSVREISYLASLCRISEDLPYDEEVEEVMRAIRQRNSSIEDYEEMPYRSVA